jgi:asparagine synthase (glutamine-hydrolysing)
MNESPTALPIARIVDCVDPASQRLWNVGLDEARSLLLADDPAAVLSIAGSFALVARERERVCLARSLARPLRYFLAKDARGPALVVAERIDEIQHALAAEGWSGQFQPTYTRMVPAHHVTTLRLIGCPDPNPSYRRFFDPPRGVLPADVDRIGVRYVGAILESVRGWLALQDAREPIGVAFSGGLDSGAVLLCLYSALLESGQSPARLKAFTLAVGGHGEDVRQAREFLRRMGIEFLAETIETEARDVSLDEAVAVIEDYKPLDVQCAAVALALFRGIRKRYPGWLLLADGDGGDENLKDYPIEENAELTIRSVVGNRMLYQEGWGCDSLKHSLVFTGGYSRACVRTHASLRRHGFVGFSPFTCPPVVAAAEAIPFAELALGSTARLYALKADIVARGVRAVLGLEMPVFAKRRFQHGAAAPGALRDLYAASEGSCRSRFLARYQV